MVSHGYDQINNQWFVNYKILFCTCLGGETQNKMSLHSLIWKRCSENLGFRIKIVEIGRSEIVILFVDCNEVRINVI